MQTIKDSSKYIFGAVGGAIVYFGIRWMVKRHFAKIIAKAKEEALKIAGQTFDELDPNKDGHIEVGEIGKHIDDVLPESVDKDLKEKALKEVVSTIDTNEDGKVSKQEWLDAMGKIFDLALQ